MLRITELSLPLDHTPAALRAAIVQRLKVNDADLLGFTVFKRSYDARKKNSTILLVYVIDAELRNEAAVLKRFAGDRNVTPAPDTSYHFLFEPGAVQVDERPLVVGFGPCGLFAALLLAQMGLRPIVLERGQDVRQRTKDTWALWRNRVLTNESNVQFGEGGAGLFSDGKLYSQIKDPKFYGRKVMQEFVRAGAPPEILYVSKPHIGTFRLTGVVAAMRDEIIALGGEVRFGSKVKELLLESLDDGDAQFSGIADAKPQQVAGVVLENGEKITSRHVVLALGHSARDTFRMLHRQGVFVEAKPFAIGFRIEHPQGQVDRARLGKYAGHPELGAADYKLTYQASNGRAVYSFCMCPGGTVVAATSEEGRVVTNGMSQYSRNERNANSGIVVGINPAQDFPGDPLAGVELQERLEAAAYTLGGSNYNAPAQLVGDFLRGEASTTLGDVLPSYKPGITLTDLASALPEYAITAMREALPAFGKQIYGFDRADAVLTGVETRTSSPLRITRDTATLQSLNVKGLYPAGEGAGYAGGILSAGVDGIRVAEAVATDMLGAPRASELP
jgi:uncharacterized FAD-dependent dehydrogenase